MMFCGFSFKPSKRLGRYGRVRPGFTLVEILIVVAVLGILAALVLPKFASATFTARANAAATIGQRTQNIIDKYYLDNGSYPTAIDASWFAGEKAPESPFDTAAGTDVQIVNDGAEVVHPRFKFFRGSGTMWYNQDNGRFRMLVPRQDNNTATLDLYNKANGVQLGNLLQTKAI